MNVRRLSLVFILIGVFWTFIIAFFAVAGKRQVYKSHRTLAESSARAFLEQTVDTRRWNASQGGVYVPITKDTPVNPYLDVPDKVITTDSGKRLTLINPAYMTREIFELFKKQKGIKGKITSLKPLNPDNAPDAWERENLLRFEKGSKQASEIFRENGREVLRYMIPLVTEKSCLKCHAKQGYKVGDIRGGLSLKLPYVHYSEAASRTTMLFFFVLFGLGLAGYGGLYASYRSLRMLIFDLNDKNARLRTSLSENILLRREADHRIKNDLSLIGSIIRLQMVENEDSRDELSVALNTQLQSVEDKINVVSRLHDILNDTSEQKGQVVLCKYLEKIVDYTVQQYPVRQISCEGKASSYKVTAKDAVAYGMILAEMLSNAQKHGGVGTGQDGISVSFYFDEEEDSLFLSVVNPLSSDRRGEGIGREPGGLGAELIRSLAPSLDGKVSFITEKDRFTALFKSKYRGTPD